MTSLKAQYEKLEAEIEADYKTSFNRMSHYSNASTAASIVSYVFDASTLASIVAMVFDEHQYSVYISLGLQIANSISSVVPGVINTKYNSYKARCDKLYDLKQDLNKEFRSPNPSSDVFELITDKYQEILFEKNPSPA